MIHCTTYRLTAAITCLTMVCLAFPIPTARASLTLAAHNQTNYTIIIPAKPPASVQAAAKELQGDIKQATGATLAIQSDQVKVAAPFISLGSTKQAQVANIAITNITPGGFRIQTKGDNLYIRGLDTVAKVRWARHHFGRMTPRPHIPGPQYTKHGGFSNGTANGVYTFLEKRLGVRWLMPGDIGRVVPKRDVFTIPDINRIEQPQFVYRNLITLQKYPQSLPTVRRWKIHQKLGFSFRLNGGHSWTRTVSAKLYKKHPDWFAMIDGKRPKPRGRYKLETTNPQLVQYFADQAVAALKANPHLNTFSLSPSDSRGYSESPASKALYDPPPPDRRHPSITPLILKWYRDVSNAVAAQYPQGKLAGFLYQDYIYPPKKGPMTLPKNFIPFIAPSFDYGYTLYRADVRKKFAYVMDSWAKIAPPMWFYYDLPNQILSRYANGIVTPPATGILNYIFPRLLKDHIKGALFYGNVSWSMAAMTNYIDAKLLWNPKLDASAIKHDWLTHAYGQQAGTAMDRFYDQLNGWFSDYWNHYHSARYHANERLFEKLYAVHYPALEKLFFQADVKPMTPPQQQRLNLIKYNLIVLQWRLRNAGYLRSNYHSSLTRTNSQVAKLLFAKAPGNAFDLFPILWYQSQPKRTRTTIKLQSPPHLDKKSSARIPNAGYILIYSTREQNIIIHPAAVHPLSSFLGYRIYTPRQQTKWRFLQKGLLYTDGTITIHAKANRPYYLSIVPQGIVPQRKEAGDVRYELHIPNAAPAHEIYQDDVLYIQPDTDQSSNIYVIAPTSLHLSTRRTPAGDVVLSTQSQADSIRQAFVAKHPHVTVALELDKHWRFKPAPHDLGLKHGYAKPAFNDHHWKMVSATDWWQDQGFANYHGVGWYRKTFTIPKIRRNNRYFLFFGNVDGNAAVYLNGHYVGHHKLGEHGKNWDQPFAVNVTTFIHPGKNTVAVKVTKNSHVAGMYRGAALLRQR